METFINLGLFAFGLVFGVAILFSSILLPLGYGLPRSLLLAYRGYVSWRAPLSQVIAPVVWSSIIIAVLLFWSWAVKFLPQTDALVTGLIVGVIASAGRTAFSKSARNDISADFATVMGRYLTQAGVERVNKITINDDNIEEQPHSFVVAEITLKANLDGGAPQASVSWSQSPSAYCLNESDTKIAAACFLLARQLINQPSTRDELISRLKNSLDKIPEGADAFSSGVREWFLKRGGLSFQVFPFSNIEQEERHAKTYKIVLGQKPEFSRLHMAFGQELILVPLSVLAIISNLASSLGPKERERLANAISYTLEFLDKQGSYSIHDDAEVLQRLCILFITPGERDASLHKT